MCLVIEIAFGFVLMKVKEEGLCCMYTEIPAKFVIEKL